MPRDLTSSCNDLGNAAPRHQRAFDRGAVSPGAHRRIEQNFEKIRGAAVANRTIGFDQLELGFGITGAGGDHSAAEPPRGRIEDEPARRQMIAEGIQHHVAGAKARVNPKKEFDS
jgi:hypothetical protein